MFEGFSDAEIKKISYLSSDNQIQSVPITNNKSGSFKSIDRPLVKAKRRNDFQRKVSIRESKLPSQKGEDECEEEKKESDKKDMPKKSSKEVKLKEVPSILKSNSVVQPLPRNKVDTKKVSFEDTLSPKLLSEFEETQKKLEAFNAERKEQLMQALSDRTKKTHEEVKKLNQIEEELKKLDSCLGNDVFILRNEIETASHEFMEAQKRFDRAEKEYVEAKMLLFTKKERKELLTSHLCSIIEQNELRKAKKLSDLMEKLEVPSKPLPTESPKSQDADEKDSSHGNNTS